MTEATNVRILDQRTPEERDRPFLPGMGRTWLLPLYDIFTGVAGVRALHERAVERAGIRPGQAVVDVGCGTGNLSFAVLAAEPDARVTGLDPDGAALRRAARKARRRGVPLTLVQGYADRIPAEDASLDHVVSSLALHHVDDDGRVAFAHDALRALRPGAGSPSSTSAAQHPTPRMPTTPGTATARPTSSGTCPAWWGPGWHEARPWPATSTTASSPSSSTRGSGTPARSSTSTTGSAGSPSCRRPAPEPAREPTD
ncbi:MAG TPA: class I SAM-dependent methyltransferase [Nocardioidaceae bacterium]|nr:class I SAM-dependent methyltransferase [Nocardioidaceae bacterium]